MVVCRQPEPRICEVTNGDDVAHRTDVSQEQDLNESTGALGRRQLLKEIG
jgi:hypothetical protein